MTRKKQRVARAIAVVGLLVAGTACSEDKRPGAVSGPTAPKLELVATEMRYTPSSIAVARGDIAVVFRNEGRVIHDVHVEGTTPRRYAAAPPGTTATTTWSLPKGRYRIFCALAGHRAAGMEGILEVR